jgi:hypothetical protein
MAMKRVIKVVNGRDAVDVRQSLAEDIGDGWDGNEPEGDYQRRQWRSHISRMARQDTTCRTVMVFGFFMVVLVGGLIAIALLAIRTSFEETHVVIGPRGPMGICNLSHANQTFLIAGDTIVGNNLTVSGSFFLDDTFNVYSNGSCVVFNSTLPLCMNNCLKTDCIDSTVPGGNVTIGGQLVTYFNSYFYGTVFVSTTLDIGGASFFWNGTTLIFTGPSNLGSMVDIPLDVNGTGTIGQNGSCMFFDATQCIEFQGTVAFLSSVQGPLFVNGTATFDPSIFIHNSSYGLQWTGTALDLFSISNELDLTSPVGITIDSPSTNVTGNVTIGGTVVDLLKLSQNGLQITCLPGPQTGTLNFSPGCGCLSISSTSGICLNASGTQGINAIGGGGNFTINGPMNLNFVGGSTIGTSATVNGDLTTVGNVNVGGSLTVVGNITYANLAVTGSSLFVGPITATDTGNYFTGLNVTALTANVIVSQFLTTFNGLGAIFPSGTTLQIASNISISSLSSQLQCTSPIFFPDTLTTPNGSPCVPECTDMQRCSPKVANLTVVGNLHVGDDFTSPVIGNVSFGIISTKALGFFTVNANVVQIQSPASVKVLADIDVTGNILQGGMTHPCCTGVGGSTLWLVVEVNGVTTSVATSEVTKVPFNLIQTPSSSLASNFNTVTNTFAAPVPAMYSITVYLSMDPAQFGSGTFRGVTLSKTFSFPTSTNVPIRICSQRTDFAAAPTPFQITCTYNAFFQAGDTFFVTAFYDFVGSLTLNGAGSVVTKPTTRLEIYQF